MRIVIDTRMYGLEHAGIGRYVANLVREISQTPEVQDDFILLVRKSKFEEIKKETRGKLELEIADYPHYSFQEQIFLPIKLLKIKPDLVHFPHFNAPILWWGKQVVTIHDLIKHESKGRETTTRWQPLYWFKYLNYHFLTWLVIKRAKRIIVPSNYWKKDLVQRFKLKSEKIVVTYEGVEEKFRKSRVNKSSKILSKYKITKPFIIYTGSLYPHKNVDRLVKAVKQLNPRLELELVVVCSRNIFYERFKKKIKALKAEKFVKLVGFVPDEELVSLYRKAEAFVFPSLLEGFGLPGLEAMAVGLPVIASKASCLPEIYGKAALYFNPYDVKEMAEKIEGVIEDKEIRKKLIKEGFKQIKRYSWQKMAKQTFETYESCLSLFQKKQNRRFEE